MSSGESPRRSRGPRTDARRNAERIMRAAAEVFSAAGVDVSLEEIAHHAGVGASTLYRHFASKDDLVHAVIRQAFADEVEPVLSGALDGQVEPLPGLISVLEAALAMAARHRNALAATKRPGGIPLDLAPSFFHRLAVVLSRAQDQGAVRADLRGADLPRLFAMLTTTMWFDGSGEGWRRYLALLLEALRPDATTSLPPLIAAKGDELPVMSRSTDFAAKSAEVHGAQGVQKCGDLFAPSRPRRLRPGQAPDEH